MTRKYYHSCIVCPTCHEPYAGSYSDFVDLHLDENGKIICNNCNSQFNRYIDFSGNKMFQETHKAVLNHSKFPFSAEYGKIPLYWNVTPNTIEDSYIEWILKNPPGSFLITWPWENVRFIPILISEYIGMHPDSKMVIVGDYESPDPESTHIGNHSLPEIIQNTFFIDDPDDPGDELKKEMSNFRKEKGLLFDLRDVIQVKFRSFGSREFVPRTCFGKLKKCSNEQKRIILGDYGNGSFKDIELIKKDGKKLSGFSQKDLDTGVIDPENGKWVLQLREEEQWSGKQNYNHIWLYEILENLERVIWCQEYFKPAVYYTANEDDHPKSGNIHLISSQSDPYQLFRMIQEIEPDILIIENSDTFMQDIRYSGPLNKLLLEYLKSPAKTTLLFSTDPEKRQFYSLNSPQNPLLSSGCRIHTLDSTEILETIAEQSDESKYPSPLSSGIKQLLHEQKSSLSIQYAEVDELTKFSDALYQLTDEIDAGLAKDIRFYLRRVVSSPLNIIGDYSDSKYLTVTKGMFGLEITYHTLFSGLTISAEDDEISENIPLEFSRLLKEIYLPEISQNVNPLRYEMLDKAKKILENNPSAYVSLVVHSFDVRGFNRIISDEALIPDSLMSRINISGWKGLTNKQSLIESGNPHYVISSQYPSLSYNLRKSNATEIIFISDKKGIEGIREIISRRLLDKFAYPVFSHNADESMPSLLSEALDATTVPEPDRVARIYEDIDDKEIFFSVQKPSQNFHPTTDGESNPDITGIEPGEEAFLCTDSYNRGIFIPIGQSVMKRENGFFNDIDTDNRRSDKKIIHDLEGSEIVLAKSGIYYSFKSIFFRFMMKEGARVTFSRLPFSWKGFRDFFEMSVRWIHLIDKTVEQVAEKCSCERTEALELVAAQLASAGLTAQESSTIIGWCENYEDILMESGTFRLYRTEHPFRKNDLRIIFEVLNNLIPGVIPESADPDEIFAAALCMQDLRLKVLKSGPDNIDTTYQNVRRGLAREMASVISETGLFSPLVVQRVEIIKTVRPMQIYENYGEFFK